MNWINELSWLWETLGIALIAAAICVACAALICKAAKKKTNKKGVGCHRCYSVCGRNSGGHSDCPDTDADLIRQEAFYYG